MKSEATKLKMALVYMFLSFLLGMTAAATPQDLTGKMFVFPRETNTAHVKLNTPKENLRALTVCMRYFTDLNRGTTFFSLATPSFDNDFLIDKTATSNQIDVAVRNNVAHFKGQSFQLNKWQSVCTTWDAASGLTQLWLDGKPSTIRATISSNINGAMYIVLGQEQDKFGGGFDINQSFVGMISDVHMWDSVLTPQRIRNYHQKMNFPEGNVLNWESLDFQITGNVLVQDEQ